MSLLVSEPRRASSYQQLQERGSDASELTNLVRK